jgi:transposase
MPRPRFLFRIACRWFRLKQPSRTSETSNHDGLVEARKRWEPASPCIHRPDAFPYCGESHAGRVSDRRAPQHDGSLSEGNEGH